MSQRIGAVVTAAALDADPNSIAFLQAELERHQVALAGLPLTPTAALNEPQQPIALPKADPDDPNQIGNMSYDAAANQTLSASGDPAQGESLFKSKSCAACHTTADGQRPKGPHLVDIGKRYKAAELIESMLKPSAKIAQGYEAYQFSTVDGHAYAGFVVSESAAAIRIREANGVERALKRAEIEERRSRSCRSCPKA